MPGIMSLSDKELEIIQETYGKIMADIVYDTMYYEPSIAEKYFGEETIEKINKALKQFEEKTGLEIRSVPRKYRDILYKIYEKTRNGEEALREVVLLGEIRGFLG